MSKNSKQAICRFCKNKLKHVFADLGLSPISNAYLNEKDLKKEEKYFPLVTYVCDKCFLVQVPEHQSPKEIFEEYAYFSSFSDTWLAHCSEYTEKVTKQFDLNSDSQVIELASNDGCLLQYFKNKNIPVLGIEPAKNVAEHANQQGIKTIAKFFGTELASQLVEQKTKADLLLGNNVLAHVPDLNDFVAGMKLLLKEKGVITMEFPHLKNLMEQNQFDTIYHEHFSYFSFKVASEVFAHHGLQIFDVEQIPTHGGSLRIYAKHQDNKDLSISPRCQKLIKEEKLASMDNLQVYTDWQKNIQKVKKDLLDFIAKAKAEKKTLACYGAPAKGNTLLNYFGINADNVQYTVDRSPHKQGKYLPGSHIPIYAPDKFRETKPDYVWILPWNIQDEIMDQMSHIRKWDGQFVICIPKLKIMK